MSEAVLVAILGLVGTLAGSFLGVVASSKLTQYRLEQLEKKVEKHNNLVERMYNLEEREEILERNLEAHEKLYAEKFKVANHRIEDLEHSARSEHA